MLRSFFNAALVCVTAFALQPVAQAQELRDPRTFGEPRAGIRAEPAGFIDQETLLQRRAARDPDLVILDVRTPQEYAAGHIDGAINIAYDQLPERAAELEGARDKDIVLYCRSGRRTVLAAQALRGEGFERLLHLDGDMLAWKAARRPTVTAAAPDDGDSALARAPVQEKPKL